ncbi:VTC domain-containing protein [Bacteroides thetaiotaomicron]|uniref:VTC domain-containing protein n=1 Tax=Bacteroides thetaiotaomicron TaxID=818 RepID=UPI0035B0F2D7
MITAFKRVNGECNIAYHTIYLDTPDRDMYVTHQNGRIVREKIRIRTYINSDLTFWK